MDDDRRAPEDPAIHRAIPLAVGILAVVALVGALGYLAFSGGDSDRSAAPALSSPPPAPAPAPQAPSPAPAPPAPAPPAPAPAPAPAVTDRLILSTTGGIAWTRRSVPLEIRASRGALRVRLEFRKNEHYDWNPIPAGRLSAQGGAAVDLPFSLARGTSAHVRWDMASTTSRDDGVSPQNSIDDDYDVVSIRAVARSGTGRRIVSPPIAAVLVTKAETTDVRATQIHVGVVFSGSAPIHLQWYEPKLWMRLPDKRVESVPIAGYAVDLVERKDVDAGTLPPARIATAERSYDVAVPPASDREYVILVRPIDVAGNVAEPHVDVQFRSQNLVLLWPGFYDRFHGDDPVPLKALTANSRPVCFESSSGDGPYEKDRRWTPLPAGEVLRPSGKPVGAWPIRIARTGSRFVWTGLRHARKDHGRLQIRLVRVTAASGCGGVVAATGRKPLIWEP